MLRIGLEDPAGPNQFLDGYDHESDRFIFEIEKCEQFHRYSLTCESLDALRCVVEILIARLFVMLGIRCMIARGVRAGSPSLTPARLRLLEKKMQSKGYQVDESNDLRVFTKFVKADNPAQGVSEVEDRRGYLLWGEAIDHLEASDLNSILASSSRSYSSPSFDDLKSLSDEVCAVGYFAYSDMMRFGFVLLTRRMVSDSSWSELIPGVSPKIYYGKEAENVWRL